MGNKKTNKLQLLKNIQDHEPKSNNTDEYTTEYDDFILRTNNIKLGSQIKIEGKTVEIGDPKKIQLSIITGLYTRSENPEFYDKTDLLDDYTRKYDVSGEFVTNNDIYYVFITEINDKTENIRYWDILDTICENSIRDFASGSVTEIEEEKLEEIIYDLASELRDKIEQELEKIGGTFPFVVQDY